MPTPYELPLTLEERTTLTEARDHHPLPYVRERAGALLKIAEGRWVAHQGLLRSRSPDTVFHWVHLYQEGGIAALKVRAGRGRNPLFPPRTKEEARQTLEELLHPDPHEHGVEQTRWRLEDLPVACPWLSLTWTGSLHRLLERLGIAWKRGRDPVHSPDPDYFSKLQFVFDRIEEATLSDGRIEVVFLDELTYYRQPSVANAYETKGDAQPLAERSCRSNTPTRGIGAVNALNGRVHFWQGRR
jgi:transposase